MPYLGVPPTGPPRPASHTSTHEWQSFEVRMRLRRAQRCVLRCEVALGAGFVADARDALDEARRLDSSTPTLEELQARFGIDGSAELGARPRSPRWIAPVAACALVATVALGGWSVMRQRGAGTGPLPVVTHHADVILPAPPAREAPAPAVLVSAELTRVEPPTPPVLRTADRGKRDMDTQGRRRAHRSAPLGLRTAKR